MKTCGTARLRVAVAGLMLSAAASAVAWERQGGAAFNLRLPDGEFWETGYGGEAAIGLGTDRITLGLCLGMSWQNVDDSAILNKVRPLIPSEPRVRDIAPVRIELGPSLRLSQPLSQTIGLGLEVGLRGVWRPGPDIIYQRRLANGMEVEWHDNVEFEVGLVGRIGLDLEWIVLKESVFFIGVAYEADLNGPKAKYEGTEIGDANYDCILIRFGILGAR